MLFEGVFKLFRDMSVREKLKVMTRWEAMLDDARNPDFDWAEQIEKSLKLGKSYRVTLKIEEMSQCPKCLGKPITCGICQGTGRVVLEKDYERID